MTATAAYGGDAGWQPATPRLRVGHLVLAWFVTAVSVSVAASILAGVELERTGWAFVVAAFIGVLNAILPPLVAALRLPFTLVLGFLLVLFLNAWMLKLASDIAPGALTVDSFWWALVAAFVAAIVAVALDPIFRTNDDESY